MADDLTGIPLEPEQQTAVQDRPEDLSGIPLDDTTLQDTYRQASAIPAEQGARVLTVAKKLGSEPAAVAANLDAASRAAMVAHPDYFKNMEVVHPRTSEWLRKPENMVQVHDDLEGMKQAENHVGSFRYANSILDSVVAGQQESALGTFFNWKTPDVVIPPNAPRTHRLAAGLTSIAIDTPIYMVGGVWGAAHGAPLGPLGAAVGAGAESFGVHAAFKSLITNLVRKGPAKDFGELVDRYKEAGIAASKGAITGGAMGAAEVATGGLGGGLILQKVAGVGAMTTAGAIVEGRTPTPDDFIDNALLLTSMHAIGVAISYPQARAMAEEAKIEASKRFVEALAENSQAAKLRARNPEAFADFIDRQLQAPAVMIPAEAFDKYFQGQNLEPREVARSLGVEYSYDHAAKSGTAVEIPQSVFQSEALDKHRPALLNDIKFSQEERTYNEQKALYEELDERLKSADADSTFKQGFQRLYDDYKAQLLQAGQDKALADKNAKLVARMVAVSAIRNGTSIEDTYRPRIFGSEAEAEAYKTSLMDADQEQAAAVEMETLQKTGGISPVLDAIIRNGGIDPESYKKSFGGELQDIKMPGLFRRGGKSVSEMAEAISSGGEVQGFEYDEYGMLDRVRSEWAAVGEFKTKHGQKTYRKLRSRLEQGEPLHQPESFDPTTPKLMQPSVRAAAFYSKLQRNVETKMGPSATAEQVRALLADVKAEEREWSGIDEFLAGKEKVSKAELLDFLRANQIEVKEVVKGDKEKEGGVTPEEWSRMSDDERDEYNARMREAAAEGGLTKFSQWQLPGGENYRELLLTLPGKQMAEADAAKLYYETWIRKGGEPEWEALPSEQQEAISKNMADVGRRVPASPEFRSPHWDESNVLAHIRFNERVDADGKRVLFIEEIQSDWHQRGRKHGYRVEGQGLIDGKGYIEWSKEADRLFGDASKKAEWERAVANRDELARRQTLESGVTNDAVPDAPFKKTWHEYALKRMIRWAAEKGFDRIAWTTGEQQAERYDLSKQVGKIAATKTKDGNFRLNIDDLTGRQVLLREGLDSRGVEEIVGKELAAKIVSQKVLERKTYEADDLKVGGEGMKGFYDKIIPDFLNKLGKRFGAKVGSTNIGERTESHTIMADKESIGWRIKDVTTGEVLERGVEAENREAAIHKWVTKTTEQARVGAHALDITPAMRESALVEGFTLFQPAWHGSPHDFEQFSLHKIGTGEGAQAYGWGLYFAGKKELAEKYRKNLAGQSSTPTPIEVRNPSTGTWVKFGYGTKPAEGVDPAMVHGAQLAYHDGLRKARSYAKQWLEEAKQGKDSSQRDPAYYQTMVDFLARIGPKDVRGGEKGQTYKVEIPEDDTLLHWSESLSEQPEPVRKALEKSGIIDEFNKRTAPAGYNDDASKGRGENLYAFIAKKLKPEGDGTISKEEKASRYLASIGVNGIKYKADQLSKGGHGGHNYVIFDDKAVKIIEKLYQEKRAEGPRASYDPLSRAIVLGKTADASSLIHELAHDWVEQLFLSVRGEAGPKTNFEMADTLRKWFSGSSPKVLEEIRREIKELKANNERTAAQDKRLAELEPVIPEIYKRGGEKYISEMSAKNLESSDKVDQEINRQFHELFARGFELHVREGKAPVGEVAKLFSSFRKWLTKIYKAASDLRVSFTPDVDRVFSRMLATEEQIAAAEAGAGIKAEANEASARAHEEAVSSLLSKQMKEVAEKRLEEMDRERSRVRMEVYRELQTSRVYRAMVDLGLESKAKGESRETKMYEYARKQARRFLEGTMGPDAEVFFEFAAIEKHGYTSGDEMAKEIATAPDFSQVIEQRVQAHMEAKFPSLKDSSESIRDEAVKAVHSDANLEGIAIERDNFRAETPEQARIRKAQAKQEAAAARVKALELLKGRSIRSATNYMPYFTAERNAALRAQKALEAEDMAAYRKAKDQQMLNHALAIEAIRMKERAKPYIDYLHDQKAAKPKEYKVDEHFVQAAELLERFGLKRDDAQYWNGKRKETLAEWAKRMAEKTEAVDIADWLQNESIKTEYWNLTFDQLRDLRDALANIRHVANAEDKAYVIFNKGVLSEIGVELHKEQAENAALGKSAPLSMKEGWVDKLAHVKDTFMFQLIAPETWLRKLDGYKNFGKWWQAFYEHYARGADEKARLLVDAADKYRAIWDAYTPSERAAMMEKKVFLPELRDSLLKSEIVTMALNWGSKSNRERLMEGRGWSEDQVKSILMREMTKRDWDTVQKTWDLVDSYWPQIAELYSDITGFEPQKIEREAIETPHGTYQGGYFPLRRDPRQNVRGAELARVDESLSAPAPAWRASTKNGFTKGRVQGATYPVSLDVNGIQRHISDVVHDLTLRKWVLDASRLLDNKDVQASIQDAMGMDGYHMMRDWVRAIAGNNGYQSREFMEGFFHGLRRHTIIANLGLRVSSTIMQVDDISAYGRVDKELGVLQVGAAVAGHYGQVIKSPAKYREAIEFVYGKSKYMRYERGENLDRDVTEAAKRAWGEEDKIGKASMAMVTTMDKLISIPVWIEAYKTGLRVHEGNEAKAVDYADYIIRRAQSSGRLGELPAIMRGSEKQKALTMFYSFVNKRLNLWYEAIDTTKEMKDVPRLAGTAMALWVMPSLFSALVHNGVPTSPEKRKKYMKEVLSYPTSLFPVVRDVADFAFDKMLGVKGFGYSPSPITRSVDVLGDLIGKVANWKKSGPQKKVEATTRAASYAIPYPDQLNVWLWNVADYMQGEMTPQAGDIFRRRPQKDRR